MSARTRCAPLRPGRGWGCGISGAALGSLCLCWAELMEELCGSCEGAERHGVRSCVRESGSAGLWGQRWAVGAVRRCLCPGL